MMLRTMSDKHANLHSLSLDYFASSPRKRGSIGPMYYVIPAMAGIQGWGEEGIV